MVKTEATPDAPNLEGLLPNKPQDHIAIALAVSAHRSQAIDRRLLNPNLALAFFVQVRLIAYRADRQMSRR